MSYSLIFLPPSLPYFLHFFFLAFIPSLLTSLHSTLYSSFCLSVICLWFFSSISALYALFPS